MAFFVFAEKLAKAGFNFAERFEIKLKGLSVVIVLLLNKTNRFHVAVRLSSNRSQKTSKCGKNISDTLGYRLVCHFFVLTTF